MMQTFTGGGMTPTLTDNEGANTMRTFKATWIAADGTRGDYYYFLNTHASIAQVKAAVMDAMRNRYSDRLDLINAGHVEVQ